MPKAKKQISTSPATGWWNPSPISTRQRATFHYVGSDKQSLCGKWLYVGLGELEEGNDEHPDNCAACKRKKLAQNNPRVEGE